MGKISVQDKIETRREKIGKSKTFFYINLHPKDGLRIEIKYE